MRGTYLGVAAPASIDHLRALGVTAVELLPIHAHADEPALEKRGLTNYWGYNTLGYFAPEPTYATAPHRAVTEFKQMVARLHAAGLEVILDVVYNHTADTDHLGPTLSLRGIDNYGYYRLRPGNPSRYEDFTGCGNTLDMRSADARQLVLDSLRYWVADMHVDGFRFDLAPALARDPVTPDRLAAFFDAIAQDPVLRGVKLIAEPWDAAPGGYQLGNFPAEWSEWNDRYRNTVRRFWRGDAGALPEFATRLAGSRDVFGRAGRSPQASINYVTTHDGFTLADLVAYNDKHNEANGEQNRDGEPRNFSWNCGVEGPTGDAAVRALAPAPAAQLRPHAFRVARRADAQRWRRAGAIAVRQQQRVLSRLAAHVDAVARRGRGARVSRVRPPGRRAPGLRAGAHAPRVSRRPG